MNLRNIFKRDPRTSVREILGNDAVKGVVQDFENCFLATAEGIIIIWVTKGDVMADMGGLSEAEAHGVLNIVEHKLHHQGVPRQ